MTRKADLLTDPQSQFCSSKVRSNLLEGLRVFRLANQERTVWVDALCINQEDRDERSQQVGLMGLIFWLAECVLIWLGRDERRIAGETFNYMQPISWGYFHSKDPNYNRPRNSTETEALDARIWGGIKELYCNPWFERVWVQQEIGLAKKARFFWGELLVIVSHLKLVQWLPKTLIRVLFFVQAIHYEEGINACVSSFVMCGVKLKIDPYLRKPLRNDTLSRFVLGVK